MMVDLAEAEEVIVQAEGVIPGQVVMGTLAVMVDLADLVVGASLVQLSQAVPIEKVEDQVYPEAFQVAVEDQVDLETALVLDFVGGIQAVLVLI